MQTSIALLLLPCELGFKIYSLKDRSFPFSPLHMWWTKLDMVQCWVCVVESWIPNPE